VHEQGRIERFIALGTPTQLLHCSTMAMDIHTLAIQMGTSIAMIERHYSHLTPRFRKEMLTGKRYELSREEFEEKVIE